MKRSTLDFLDAYVSFVALQVGLVLLEAVLFDAAVWHLARSIREAVDA